MKRIETLNAWLEETIGVLYPKKNDDYIKRAKITYPKDRAVCIIDVGDNNDIVQSVRVFVQSAFGGSFGVAFGVCDNLPTSIVRKVWNKHFDIPFDALTYITDVAKALNDLNRNIQLDRIF